MSTTDFNFDITTGRHGNRVHRVGCKRASNPTRLSDATAAQAVGAVPAGCCKPNAEQVGRALLALSVEREAEQVLADSPAEPGQAPAESPAEDGQATVTVAYDGNGLPKGLFKPLATDAAERLAEATGVRVEAVRATRTVELTGDSDKVAEAEQVVRQWWDWAYGAFREWKRTDEYRTLRQELPSKNLWQREQEWLGALDVEAVAR